MYEIVEVKDRTLSCPKEFHKEKMRLVRLEKPKLYASMHNKDIYVGSIVNFKPVSCHISNCKFYEYCEPHKLLLQKGTRVKVKEIVEKIDECPRDLHLSVVKMERK